MKFSIKNFFSKYDQICRKLRLLSHLPKKFLMENFIFCVVARFYKWHVRQFHYPAIFFKQVVIRQMVCFLLFLKSHIWYISVNQHNTGVLHIFICIEQNIKVLLWIFTPFSTNVPFMYIPGSWFLLATCLKNTCGRVTWPVDDQHLYFKCLFFTGVFQTFSL